VSNHENIAIRLSLLQYFGFMAHHDGHYHASFNRVVARFGFTLMEQLFALIEQSKCSSIALHFLIEVATYILEADRRAQQILQQTLKSFMFKEPDRFLLFVEAFTRHLSALPAEAQISRNLFVQHLAMLVQVIAETNHKGLTNNLLFILATHYQEASYAPLLAQLQEKQGFKARIKAYLKDLTGIRTPGQLAKIENILHMKKRGRKPAHALGVYKNPLSQISILGKFEVLQAG
jgi:hypothetical protein